VAATDPDLALFLFSFYLFYYVFIVVAIWRSSEKYRGDRIWGMLARIAVMLGVIRTVADLFTS
jgi:hypothetical protein